VQPTGRFQKCDSARTTHTCRWRFSGRLTGVLCKRPFAEFVAKSEFGDSGHRRTPTGDVSKIATDRLLSKNATVRYRPVAARGAVEKRTLQTSVSGKLETFSVAEVGIEQPFRIDPIQRSSP
jgi:hypothetical protein